MANAPVGPSEVRIEPTPRESIVKKFEMAIHPPRGTLEHPFETQKSGGEWNHLPQPSFELFNYRGADTKVQTKALLFHLIPFPSISFHIFHLLSSVSVQSHLYALLSSSAQLVLPVPLHLHSPPLPVSSRATTIACAHHETTRPDRPPPPPHISTTLTKLNTPTQPAPHQPSHAHAPTPTTTRARPRQLTRPTCD